MTMATFTIKKKILFFVILVIIFGKLFLFAYHQYHVYSLNAKFKQRENKKIDQMIQFFVKHPHKNLYNFYREKFQDVDAYYFTAYNRRLSNKDFWPLTRQINDSYLNNKPMSPKNFNKVCDYLLFRSATGEILIYDKYNRRIIMFSPSLKTLLFKELRDKQQEMDTTT